MFLLRIKNYKQFSLCILSLQFLSSRFNSVCTIMAKDAMVNNIKPFKGEELYVEDLDKIFVDV